MSIFVSLVQLHCYLFNSGLVIGVFFRIVGITVFDFGFFSCKKFLSFFLNQERLVFLKNKVFYFVRGKENYVDFDGGEKSVSG